MMSEMVRLSALLRFGRGVGVRVGLAILALGVTGVFSATVTWAADDQAAASAGDTGANNIDEIVVTARKRSENLRDIPASITAISAATIEEAHIPQLADLSPLLAHPNINQALHNTPH